jgi:hypothetical protein
MQVREGLRRGLIRFTLYGEKLRGGWDLRRMADGGWLLSKLDDEFASSRDVRQLDRSVLSGRALDDLSPKRVSPPPSNVFTAATVRETRIPLVL